MKKAPNNRKRAFLSGNQIKTGCSKSGINDMPQTYLRS